MANEHVGVPDKRQSIVTRPSTNERSTNPFAFVSRLKSSRTFIWTVFFLYFGAVARHGCGESSRSSGLLNNCGSLPVDLRRIVLALASNPPAELLLDRLRSAGCDDSNGLSVDSSMLETWPDSMVSSSTSYRTAKLAFTSDSVTVSMPMSFLVTSRNRYRYSNTSEASTFDRVTATTHSEPWRMWMNEVDPRVSTGDLMSDSLEITWIRNTSHTLRRTPSRNKRESNTSPLPLYTNKALIIGIHPCTKISGDKTKGIK
ncbi:hypothetical protein OGAPHI_003224 [Ogataea philodendri]|uniref:Uncharacterized protein n=1 Tax=Ogataea philodendri TaxID=1378263 RepID=A0A9P8P855_9ASCO|nr:uncharacterized protein OGAPHI_003224 [Ogataea philodendri]KAH3666775.1 hypothetical protein OGAPHI_003224 [Ogataea philodendri]